MLPVDGAQISLWGLKKSKQIILHGDGDGPVGQSYRIVSDIGRGAQHQLRSRAYHTSYRRPRQRAYKSPSVRPQEIFPSLFIFSCKASIS
jgi:ketol-acid reductoisomerase